VPVDAYRPTFVKSMVMTPVRPDDPIAAIGAYWATRREPSADEVMKLELIARATATALENAQLYGSLTSAVAERDGLIAELDHRVKNVLASVMSMASQTLRSAPSPDAFRTGFNGRLMCLSRAHDLLAAHAWRGAPVAEVVEEAMRPFETFASRLSAAGPAVILAPEAASGLLLILHELADNAKAHGAWNNGRGRVRLDWEIDGTAEPHRFRLSWREQGGPPPREPQRRGFGSRLIEAGLARPPSGEARLAFPPDGAVFELAAPLSDRIRRPD
jgi:two-component sensor histidine kinase